MTGQQACQSMIAVSDTSGQETEKDMPLMCWRAMRKRGWFKRGGYWAWTEVNAWWATLQGSTSAAQDATDWRRETWYSECIILNWGMLLICLDAGRKSHHAHRQQSDVVIQSTQELWKPLLNINSLYSQNSIFILPFAKALIFSRCEISSSCLVWVL